MAYILTSQGLHFNPMAPEAKDIDILDIAHALSNLCRFTGHVRKFYSVAEHSVHVADVVYKDTSQNPRAGLKALLHDASEAYLIDVPKPLKELPEFEFYRDTEALVQLTINNRFGLENVGFSTEIKQADDAMLNLEAFHLMPDDNAWDYTHKLHKQACKLKNFGISLHNWTPTEACEHFLCQYSKFSSEISRLGTERNPKEEIQQSVTRTELGIVETQNLADQKFCWHCGRKLRANFKYFYTDETTGYTYAVHRWCKETLEGGHDLRTDEWVNEDV
jgi:uncharacterized protein